MVQSLLHQLLFSLSENQLTLIAIIGLVSSLYLVSSITGPLVQLWNQIYEFTLISVPTIRFSIDPSEASDDGVSSKPLPNHSKPSLTDSNHPGQIQCFDPSTLQLLGYVTAMNATQVHELCAKAKVAQRSWARTTFAQRRMVLRTLQKYIVSHQEEICRVCSRDSGKAKVDALLGEVMTTCEKIRCINAHGEHWLQRQYRPTGPMMLHKTAYVEYVPFGVLGIIAPWNYPFHNMLNHVISGLFSGNAVVTKVSEHTSWSAGYFTRMAKAALTIHGHDPDVVQTITGFGEAGAALVQCQDVDKIIFTGSPAVGKKVMEGCSKTLKPCVLELGGKDPMVFCEDVIMKVKTRVYIPLSNTCVQRFHDLFSIVFISRTSFHGQ